MGAELKELWVELGIGSIRGVPNSAPNHTPLYKTCPVPDKWLRLIPGFVLILKVVYKLNNY